MKIDLGWTTVTIRPWTVKDRKEFKKAVKERGEELTESDIQQILVYNCVEENVALSKEELRYVIAKIREISISSDFEFHYRCEKCGGDNDHKLKLEDFYRPKLSKFGANEITGHAITFSPIANPDFYKKTMSEIKDEDEKLIVDLALHISDIDGDASKSLQEIIDLFDTMVVSEMDEIYSKYRENAFDLDDIYDAECTHCQNKEKFKFDEIPGFLPENWIS